MPEYITIHNRSAFHAIFSYYVPEDQVIKTDPTNILIRSLTIKKSKSESKAKEKQKSGADVMKGKR
jgi:hypothetical protein